jgi:hypothetical protein
MASNKTIMNFFSRGSYKSSKRTKEDGPFKCQACQKIFAGKSGLWRHLKRRLDEEDPQHEAIKGSIKTIKELIGLIQRAAMNISTKLDFFNIS